ncbi:hypothetical protein [Streptomyces sp. NPDC051079]|uniref:hypothetical protein n=1 Tax=Streptomyces sp. NPDC051079 TaxID=3155043 RepID=UPI00344D68C8
MEFRTSLDNAKHRDGGLSLAHMVLGAFGHPDHRAPLSKLIGESCLLICSPSDRSSLGSQWIADSVPTAWRIWLAHQDGQHEDPMDFLERNWDLR